MSECSFASFSTCPDSRLVLATSSYYSSLFANSLTPCKDSRHSALIKMLTDHPHQGLARHDCVASTCLVLPKTLPQAETAPTYSEETEAQAGQVDHPHQGTELESARTHGSPNPSCLPTPPLARGSASLDPPAAYMGSGLCCFDTPRSPPPQQPSSDTLVSVWAFCEGKF